MTSYFDHNAYTTRKPDSDVIEWKPVPLPESDDYTVEELTDEQWAALVKRLAGAA